MVGWWKGKKLTKAHRQNQSKAESEGSNVEQVKTELLEKYSNNH